MKTIPITRKHIADSNPNPFNNKFRYDFPNGGVDLTGKQIGLSVLSLHMASGKEMTGLVASGIELTDPELH